MDSTCRTVIRGAAAGEARDRDDFARRYLPAVRAYLGARWRGQPLFDDVEDAAQEVFVECFKAGGALDKADSTRPGGFRAFLFGIARNVAARHERRRARQREQQPPTSFDVEASDEGPATVFDRAWARAMMREAVALHRERTQTDGEDAVRRWELLRMRFEEGLPIRAIAERWNEDPTLVHRAYARARDEFKVALREVVTFHGHSPAEAEAECRRLTALFR